MNFFKSLAFVSLILLVAGCATGRPQNAQDFHQETESHEGFARLYIYRLHNDVGGAIWSDVSLNGTKVVGLKDDAYTTILIKPGRYNITTEDTSIISGFGNIAGTINIEDTGAYYLKFDVSYETFTKINGSGYAEPDFKVNYQRWTVVPKDEALKEISGCYFIDPAVKTLP